MPVLMMKTEQIKTFDLDTARPKVLLIGNGLTYGTSIPWGELIKRVSRTGVDVSQYEEIDSKGGHIKFQVPNTILTMATSDIKDKDRHRKYTDILNLQTYPINQNIQRLMEIPFDAVLTTNYTYELEASLHERYTRLKPTSKRKYAATTKKEADAKYLLHTYNRVSQTGPDIWHIHGELRCPSSMILSHDEYARHISRVLQYNQKRGNDYEKYRQEMRFKSWIDYFLLGDVFIIGLSMDFSEFDLWWLLGRRLREKTECGSIVFYEPMKEENRYKQLALADCGVTVENCNVNIDLGGTYDQFYQYAIKDLENRIMEL